MKEFIMHGKYSRPPFFVPWDDYSVQLRDGSFGFILDGLGRIHHVWAGDIIRMSENERHPLIDTIPTFSLRVLHTSPNMCHLCKSKL